MALLKRNYLKIIIALAIMALLFLALRPTPLLVDSETVSRGPLRQSIEEEGRTRVVDSFVISAPLAAEVRRLDLDPGDPVSRGQVVAVLDAVAAPPLDVREIAAARARVEAVYGP
ncbi:hypothetical protein [Desulfurivibrio sp. C05AmB]|uniref:hypothetical protein n=1 Tax=Desulfurivibrio sp. C05AmB TaxID=3374371 RepID=UPI00376F426C